jgi:hypothetical protein
MIDPVTVRHGDRLPMDVWVQRAVNDLPRFLGQLRVPSGPAQYIPARRGVLPTGSAIGLGYTAFAIKLHVLLGTWELLTSFEREQHVAMIQSFQTDVASPDGVWDAGAFIDPPLVDYLSRSASFTPSLSQHLLTMRNTVRAESKQAIASLIQVGASPRRRYVDLPGTVDGVRVFLETLDWEKPWSAGGQASALAMLLATGHGSAGHDAEFGLLEMVRRFFRALLDPGTGAYFSGMRPDHGNLVNGAMKVLTALDWLDEPVHAPERLIDTCLSALPSHEGCHLVDAVYVLHQCRKYTDHRSEEVRDFGRGLLEMIRLHHNPDGGFSYWIGKSQTVYYGVPITSGMPVSDIHGTLLLTWALAMVLRLIDDGNASLLASIRP